MLSNHLKSLLERVDRGKSLIDRHRPLSKSIVQRLHEQMVIEWTYHSNAIEGNTLTLKETALILKEGLTIGGKSFREHLEVINHKDAILFVEELANKKNQITERDLKDIHALILKEIDQKYAGRYRDVRVRITGTKHVPPEPFHVPELMKKFSEKYLHHFSGHPIEQAALAHHQIASIHPFVDGNGRTARLLMNLILIKNGYPPTIILNNDRKKYYSALAKADESDTMPFIQFIARSVERSLALYMEAIPELQDQLVTFAQAEKISSYSRHYLGVMARRGVIPAFKLKRNWVIFRHALKNYEKRQKKK